MDFSRRIRSSNVQGFASKMLTLYEEEEEQEEDCAPLHIALLLTVAKKRVCAPVAHKMYFLLWLW